MQSGLGDSTGAPDDYRAGLLSLPGASSLPRMSKTGIALAVIFLGLALFQGARGFFVSDPAPPPASPPPATTPSSEPSATETTRPEPFPPASGPVPQPRAYSSTDELVGALSGGGIDCSSLEVLEDDDPTLEEFSLCDPGTTQRRLNIYFYPAPANRKLWVGNLEAQKFPLPLVWGPNWIIVGAGDPETAHERVESVQGAIGGTIEDFAPKK